MGIIDDSKNICNTWNELGPLSKLLSCSTVLLAGMSIASIADATFKFKGFIKTGIEFYRSITEPIRALIEQLVWFDVSEPVFHLFMLLLVALSANIRASMGLDKLTRIVDLQ